MIGLILPPIVSISFCLNVEFSVTMLHPLSSFSLIIPLQHETLPDSPYALSFAQVFFVPIHQSLVFPTGRSVEAFSDGYPPSTYSDPFHVPIIIPNQVVEDFQSIIVKPVSGCSSYSPRRPHH